uniref:CUB domain-containing protein n=1 Tax=Tetranychus urticae TaxID=32264 RepID=T1KT51_TETUR
MSAFYFVECVYVQMLDGIINLPTEPGKNCCWIIEFYTPDDERVESFLFLQTIDLERGDFLSLHSIADTNYTSQLFNITDSLSNHLFFTGTKKNLLIRLTTSSANSSTRSFHLFLESQMYEALIPILDDTVLKLLPVAGKPDVAKADWTFNLALSANQNKKKLAASVDSKSTGIVVKFEKIWTDLTPDYLSSNEKIELRLFIQNISSAGNYLAISVYSVTDACSSYTSLTVKDPKTTVAVKSEDLKNLIDVKCLWIINADNPDNWLNINFDSKEPIDVKAGNFFVIRKGNRKSSPVMFIISSSNFADIRANIYNSIIDSFALYITYEAFETNGEHPHFDVLRPVVNNYIVGGQKLDFSIPNMPTKFLFKANANFNAVLSAAPGQKFANNTYIYDSPIMSSDKLLAVFKADDVCPDSLWSNSDLLVLDFKELPSKMIIELKSEPANLGSTARQSKGNLVLFSNQLDCKSSYNWFIPPIPTDSNQDYQMVKSLVISNLALEQGGSLSIKSYAYGGSHEFTITGENVMSLPTFYLDSNISHSIIYRRADVCDKNSITLIQASIDTISYDACANIEVTAKQDFVSCDYPNNYPLTEWTMTKNCRHMNSTSSNIYISFNDVDLVDNHSLEFLGSTGTVNLTKSNIPGDTIVSNKVAINFNRVFNGDVKTVRTLGERLSGRGFNATLEPIECGGVSMNKSGLLNINGTDKPEKCIWIIQTPIEDTKTINFLNFTLSDGLKDAKVYDSNSRKDARTLNITGSGYYNSSTETIIVEFTTSSNPVQINWSTMVCSDRCIGVRRCINPSERCNNVNDCGDWSDELHCNGTAPVPSEPKIVKSGVPGLMNYTAMVLYQYLHNNRINDVHVDEMYREAPIDEGGMFNYTEFTKILKHGAKDKDDQ